MEPFYGGLSRKVPVSLHGASIVRIDHGKIIDWSDYYDGLTSRRTALASYFTESVDSVVRAFHAERKQAAWNNLGPVCARIPATAVLSGSQSYALISFTTLCADSIAPCIPPFHRDVCSPAKKIRPSLRALTGIQFSSPGPNDVRPPRCQGSSLQLFTRAASNCSRAPGNTISASASVCCTRLCTSIVSSFAAVAPMTYDSRRPRSSGASGPSAQNLSDTRSVFANPLSPFAFQNCFCICRNILSTGKYCSSRITRCFSADNLASANRFLATENGSADTT